ncbi:MAG TPA: DUF2267 domain-containing protein [Chitinophagaceae bacterium]|nr:DUF2267 domain-containing protein [Chitinophagaceae bacterium]
MSYNFQQFADEGNKFINTLADALGRPEDTPHASRVTHAIFRAMRDRITVEQSMHLVSQLPMALKAVYVDGWKISRERSDAKTGEEFLDDIRANTAGYAGRDFGNDRQMKEIVRTFLMYSEIMLMKVS